MDFGFFGMKRRITPLAGFLTGLGLLWFPAITCREKTLPEGDIRVSGSYGRIAFLGVFRTHYMAAV